MLSKICLFGARGLVLLVLLGATLLGATQGSLAQEPVAHENAPSETFGEEIDVRIVNLEAVVADAAGNPVTGLGREDFRLTIEGRSVAIDYFAEVRGGQVVAGTQGGGDSEARPTDVLVFLDGLFGQAHDQELLVQGLSDQLDRLGAGDRMAIVLYDGHRNREISGWSSSPRELRQALEGFRPSPRSGAAERLETAAFEAGEQTRREFEEESVGPEGQDSASAFSEAPELQMRKKRLEARLDRVARAAAAAMQSYGDGVGRKVLLLMGGGWPYNSVQFFRDPRWGDPPDNSRSLESLFLVADAANHLGFVLYPVDVPRSRPEGRREYQIHAALDFLAEETGGKAFKNREALGALGRVVEDSQGYYWLGFTAEQGQADARRRVRLEVVRPGLEVRSSRRLIDRTRQSEMSARVAARSLMGTGLMATADDDGPALHLELGSPHRHGLRLRLPVRLTLPLDAILLLPGPEGYTADLELRISAIDENGFLSRIPLVPWRFSGPAPTAGQTVSYETTLELRRLGHTVTVAVYDRNSGVLLTGEGRFRM